MSKRPYVVRKWTDGLRGATNPDQAEAGTYDSKMVVSRLLDEVDPGAGSRYREQMRNKTLRWYRVLTPEETAGRYAIFHVSFTEGSDFPNHYHKGSQATILIVEGTGYVILDGERHEISAGDVVHIPPGVAHEFFVARGCPRFGYVSVTEPDIVLDPVDGKVDWYTLPSGRYAEDGSVRDE
jgi:quercetin dioxygenase-like cupin family protein